MSDTRLTVKDKILLAAHRKFGTDEFGSADVVVAAWEAYPEAFSLDGHQHPDSNRVLSSLMGSRGMVDGHGSLTRIDKNRYRLTPDGLLRAVKLLSDPTPEPRKKPTKPAQQPRDQRLTVTLDRLLERCLQSDAVARFRAGRKNDVTFADAMWMWRLSREDSGDIVGEKIKAHGEALQAAEEALSAGGPATLTSRRMVSAGVVRELWHISGSLEERFERSLHLMRQRVLGGGRGSGRRTA